MTWCNKFWNLLFINKVYISLLYIVISCIILCDHSSIRFLYCTWLGCTKSCMEDSSYGFLISRWLVYNQLIIRGCSTLLPNWMTGLGHEDRFFMVSALLCMVTHRIGSTIIHDIRLSSSHNFIKLFHCVISQPWENIELVLKLSVTITYG